MRAHVIEGGKVVNTIEVDSLSVIPNLVSAENGGNIGDSWGGGNVFTPQPAPSTPVVIPTAVSMRQARLALLSAGLLQSVNAAIATIPGIQGDAARIEWEYATEVCRDSALVSGLSAALNLANDQLDALFIAAEKL